MYLSERFFARPVIRIALASLALLTVAPLLAQQGDGRGAKNAGPRAMPSSLQPDDPWLYQGSDIPRDREWLFGELPNGLRYAVRSNQVPPDQVSIRIRIDAGSLYESESEQGYAHLIEHLTFRESKYLTSGEAIPAWQRLGATFGSDTNAETTPTHTVYKLDLPNARSDGLDQSMRYLSGMIREPALSDANLGADVPIVLAEARENGGAAKRVGDATRATFFAGQLLADRSPIGTPETLRAATQKSVRAFHQRWYRPENTVIVISGDGNVRDFAALVEHYFADWTLPRSPAPQPDFGTPKAPPGADPANPVGITRVLVEPDLPRNISYGVMRPWVQVTDNIEYNRGILLDSVAQAIINRRLEGRARSGGSLLFASIGQEKISRSVDGTFVNITPIGQDWKAALADVRAVIADALANPPTQEEIDREVAEYDVVFANMVEQRSLQAGAKLSEDIVTAVDIRETVASPEVILGVFSGMRGRFTPQAVLEHSQGLFEGLVINAFMTTAAAGEGNAEALRQALLEPVIADASSRRAEAPIAFADLPAIGVPGTIVREGPMGVLQIQSLEFDNGVRAAIWRTENEPGRITVRVRFGNGMQSFAPQDAAYIELGKAALISQGMGPLGQNELDRIATGRKLGFDFAIEEGTFTFDAQTRPADLADQLYLFAAKLAMPRWDAGPVERSKAAAQLGYESLSTGPGEVLTRDLDYFLHGGDDRFRTVPPPEMAAATAEQFRQVWEPRLAEGPVEIMVFGDIDPLATRTALARSFGALPPRRIVPPGALNPPGMFGTRQETPEIVYHRGDAEQAAAVIAWPTGGGVEGIRISRELEILSQIFSNRLLDAVREQAGASYAPNVATSWPLDLKRGGRILAVGQLPPDAVPGFFAEAEAIAADLAANGPSTDELSRVTEPLHQLINRATSGHVFWMYQVEGATFDHRRVEALPSLLKDFTETTPGRMRALAAQYLVADKAWRLAVLPQGAALAPDAVAPLSSR